MAEGIDVRCPIEDMEVEMREIGMVVEFGFEKKEKIFGGELRFEVKFEEVGEMVGGG